MAIAAAILAILIVGTAFAVAGMLVGQTVFFGVAGFAFAVGIVLLAITLWAEREVPR